MVTELISGIGKLCRHDFYTQAATALCRVTVLAKIPQEGLVCSIEIKEGGGRV